MMAGAGSPDVLLTAGEPPIVPDAAAELRRLQEAAALLTSPEPQAQVLPHLVRHAAAAAGAAAGSLWLAGPDRSTLSPAAAAGYSEADLRALAAVLPTRTPEPGPELPALAAVRLETGAFAPDTWSLPIADRNGHYCGHFVVSFSGSATPGEATWERLRPYASLAAALLGPTRSVRASHAPVGILAPEVAPDPLRQALLASEERFTRFMHHLPGLAWIKDLQGRYVYANDAAVRAFGTPRPELYGKQDDELFPAATATQFMQNDQRALAGETGIRTLETLQHDDGMLHYSIVSKFPILGADGRVALIGGTAIDVTDRLNAEEALRHERELFNTIVETIPVMITIYEPDTTMIRLNREFQRVTGWTMEDAAATPLMELCYPDPEYRSGILSFMQSCREGWLDLRLRTKAGTDIDTSWANIRLFNGTQVGIGIDITARKQVEAELRESDQRKDEFFAILAHELRNPLASMVNALEVARLVGHADPAAERMRAVAERQTLQLTRLVDDLLDVARISRGVIELRWEPVDFTEVTRQAGEAARHTIEGRGRSLLVSLPEEALWMRADGARLEQVIGNLLNNAAKYTEAGGEIRLTLARDGDWAEVRVRDNGRGIPPDRLSSIFDLFSQAEASADRSLGGLGIGLTLVRDLTALHGGTVEASSQGPGQGAEFRVRLPLSPLLPSAAAAAAPTPVAARQTVRVLIVDDSTDGAETLRELLQLWGYEATAVFDGETALAEAAHFRPDVALLDIGLPGMDGYAVARRMLAGDAPAPLLVALSGYGQERDRRRAREAGFAIHLTKPVDPGELHRILNTLSQRDP